MSKLTYADRVKIEALHEAGFSASKIAEQLGRHRSSITRELTRNAHNGVYKADYATSSSKQRRQTCGKASLTENNWTQIGMVQKRGILVNTMRDGFSPFWYALSVHMMFKNLGNLCGSFKARKT